jgi:hypothetical protein
MGRDPWKDGTCRWLQLAFVLILTRLASQLSLLCCNAFRFAGSSWTGKAVSSLWIYVPPQRAHLFGLTLQYLLDYEERGPSISACLDIIQRDSDAPITPSRKSFVRLLQECMAEENAEPLAGMASVVIRNFWTEARLRDKRQRRDLVETLVCMTHIPDFASQCEVLRILCEQAASARGSTLQNVVLDVAAFCPSPCNLGTVQAGLMRSLWDPDNESASKLEPVIAALEQAAVIQGERRRAEA